MALEVTIYRAPMKNPMLAYTAETEQEARALSAAARHIDTMNSLGLFHQIGIDDNTGFHGWEIWRMAGLQDLDLEVLAMDTQDMAREFFKRWYSTEQAV